MTTEQTTLLPSLEMQNPYVIMAVIDGEDGQTEKPLGRRDGFAAADRFRKEMIGFHADDAGFVTAYLLPAHPGSVEMVVAPNCTVLAGEKQKLWFRSTGK